MNKNISENIRTIREMKNLTRKFVASEMDMSISGYGKIERGEIDLTISKLSKIASVFGVSLNDLLFLDISYFFNKSYNKSSNHDYVDNNIKKHDFIFGQLQTS
ncbi:MULTISPECIES: helix-turn-helix domain-containing protein [unclassified Flavobacterium]|uniref:helix-turn-helix domain-containing protein n=2 Tax=Flavobacterium TaxID=237 RepID=UPI00069184EB|nr:MULTISPECIES: helix-turn-helix transcriptional regulator [unclassified Flavobacterium]MEA9414109.1 helix-turn-helix transcriptional regulator [Flavobacterium sp. PL02]OUL60068.1 transcriptional regulator [Flavobacterium sp. AJR]